MPKAHLATGELDIAEEHLRKGLDIRRMELGRRSFPAARSERNLAELMIARGELPTAQILLTRARANLARSRPGHWRVTEAESLLGLLWTKQGKEEGGLHCLELSYKRLLAEKGALAASTREARQRLESVRNPRG